MSSQLLLRRGTTAQNNVFTGGQGELTMDTDLNTLRLHNNFTPGGFALATRVQVSNGTFYFNDNTGGGSAANAYILAPKANTNTPTSYQDGIQLGFVTTNANTGPSTANFTGLGVKPIKYPGGVDPAAGEVFGRVYLIYDAVNDWLELQHKALGPPPQLRTVGAVVSGNAMTVSLQPATIDFRSPSLGSGNVNPRTITSQLSLTIPAGATLGTSSAILGRVVILAVDNAGTVSLAVVNQTSTINFDETTLLNVTAISAGANSANTVYGVATASGLPFRVVGYVESTQPTAGTWTTVPSQIQGWGGQALFGLIKSTIVDAGVQNSTSGTSIDFLNIPATVKRITFIANSVSTNGAARPLIQLGTSSGVDTAGYQSTYNDGTITNSVNGFLWGGAAASNVITGIFVITRIAGNNWIMSGQGGNVGTATFQMFGSKNLAAAIDRVRFTTSNGTDVFDQGSVNIFYES